MNNAEGYTNKKDLVAHIAAANGITKRQADAVVNSAIEFLENTFARGEKFRLVNFGVFSVRKRPAGRAMNINTRETVLVPAHNTVHFKPAQWLRTLVNR